MIPRPSPAARALAAHHLRRSPAATIGLVVLLGLLAGVPMAVVGAARYADGAVTRFLVHSDPPENVVNTCPPGVDPTAGIDACTVGVDLRRDRDLVRELDGVEGVEIGGFAVARGGADPDPGTWGSPTAGLVVTGPAATAGGDPLVVRGRLAARGAADELMITEAAARRFGIDVGDQLHLAAPDSTDPFASEVVGIIRTVDDIVPVTDAVGGSFYAREGWVEAHADDVVVYQALLVDVGPGIDSNDLRAMLPEALPERFTNVEELLSEDQLRTTEQAIDFERRAITALAAAAAVGAALVAAQIVLRLARWELRDAAILRSLGASRRLVLAATLCRWAPVAVGAAIVAVATSAIAASLGPIGVARRSIWSDDPRLDIAVAAAGALAVLAVVATSATLAARRPPRPRRERPGITAGGPVLRVSSAFLSRALRRRTTASLAAAVATTGLALGAAVAAGSVTGSLDRVIDEPARFGAPYDAMVPASGDQPDIGELASVSHATRFLGSDMVVGGRLVWTQANLPVPGYEAVPPVMVEGRAPETDGEIALGPRTIADLGLDLGDGVQVEAADGQQLGFSVVGIAPVTDGYESNVGHGALVSEAGLERLDPTALLTGGGDVAVRFADGVDHAEAVREVRAAYAEAYVPFPVPSTLQNADRLAPLARYLAAVAAVSAVATLVHAMHVLVRSHRRELAVLRALGCTRHQVRRVVLVVGVALGLAAAAVGLVVGVVGGSRGWGLIAGMFGVDRSVLVPGLLLAVGTAGTVALAVLAAVLPAQRAATVPAAEVLRTS